MSERTRKDNSRSPSGSPRIGEVWVISADEALCGRLLGLLSPQGQSIHIIPPDRIEQSEPVGGGQPPPAFIILDINRDMTAGMKMIRKLKRDRIRAPVVVLTQVFSREFGEKILTEGIQYYFSHDFYETEFIELTQSLMRTNEC